MQTFTLGCGRSWWIRILGQHPIALQLRTVIAILSYADDLVFGITADYDATPDVDELARGIEQGVARLVASCTPSRRGQSKIGRRKAARPTAISAASI